MPVVLITGASSGIGKHLALHLASKGYSLVLGDVAVEAGKALETELNQKYGPNTCVFQKCNVVTDLKALFDLAISKYNQINIVVNNAGIASQSTFTQQSKDEWKRVLEIDLSAVIEGTQLGIQYMNQYTKSGQKLILNVSSMAGIEPLTLDPVYTASKFGVVGFTRSLAYIYKKYGIRMNCLCPFFIETSLTQNQNPLFQRFLSPLTMIPMEEVMDAFMKVIDGEMNGKCLGILPGQVKVLKFQSML